MNIALVGCGVWGRNILRDLLALDARTVVVDIDPAARQHALGMGAASAQVSPAAAAEVDGWIVATPATTHASVIGQIAALGSTPILCEKPLCADIAEADAIAACLHGPLHLMDVWRHHPAVEQLGHLALGGALGAALGLRLTRANWTSPRTDVDTVWNLAPHEVSIYLQIFGAIPQPVAAQAEWVDGNIRSLWSHWGSTASPWMVSEVSNRFERRRREIRLHCADGVWVYDGVEPVLRAYAGAADARLEAAVVQTLPLETETALRRQLAQWLKFLRGGQPPRSDLQYGQSVVTIIDGLRRMAGTTR